MSNGGSGVDKALRAVGAVRAVRAVGAEGVWAHILEASKYFTYNPNQGQRNQVGTMAEESPPGSSALGSGYK